MHHQEPLHSSYSVIMAASNSLRDIQHLTMYYQGRIRNFLGSLSKTSQSNKATTFSVHPLMLPEILHNVFRYLPVRTLVRVNLVCRRWHEQAVSYLWRDPFFRPYREGNHIKENILPFVVENIYHVQSLNLAYARWDVVEAIATLPVPEFPAVTRLDLFCATLDEDLLATLLQKTPHLRVLDLKQSDNLNAACIQSIQQLAHLDTLSIDIDIRVWPSKIRRLKWCDAKFCSLEKIKAAMQGILDSCPLLVELVLQEIQSKDPSWLELLLAGKPNLRRLSLYVSELDGSVLPRVAPSSLQHLTRFDISISDNVKASDVMAVFTACPSITSTFISGVEGLELDKLPPGMLGRLQELRVTHLDISEASIHAILDGCWSLRRLSLNDLGAGMKALAQTKPWAFSGTLRELNIERLRFGIRTTDRQRLAANVLTNLSQLTGLQSLMIVDSDITFKIKRGIKPLAKLLKLQQLALFGLGEGLDFREIRWITATFPALEELTCCEVKDIPIRSWLTLYHPEISLNFPTGQWKTMQIKDPLSFEN